MELIRNQCWLSSQARMGLIITGRFFIKMKSPTSFNSTVFEAAIFTLCRKSVLLISSAFPRMHFIFLFVFCPVLHN